MFTPVFFQGVRIAHLFSFLCCVFCFVFSELRCEVIVRFVDIDEFIDNNILNFLFMN